MNNFKSTYLKYFLATMLSVLLLSSVHSQDQIKPHIANYEVSVRGIKGNLDTTLSAKENVYVAKNDLNASGIASIFLKGNVKESSTFSILNSYFLPVSFSSFDTMSKEEKSISIRFEKNKNLIFVASPRKFKIKVYEKQPDNSLTFIEDIYCGSGVDNIEFDTNNNLWVGAHPNLLQFMSYANSYHSITPSEIIKIQYFKKGNYKVETIYLEKGEEMSGSTVAAPFENLILMGNVMDKHFVILEKN